MIKPGRNAPCPCGSGAKYKRCHGRLDAAPMPTVGALGLPVMRPPQALIDALRKHVQQQQRYKEKHGLGKPIIHTNLHGYKIVAVGNEIHWTKEETCKFFPDFVGKHLKTILGKQWGNAELAKPLEERHQILKWYDSLCRYQRSIPREADGTFAAAPNGASMAWYRLAYDLYLIRHNAKLQNRILDRLRECGHVI